MKKQLPIFIRVFLISFVLAQSSLANALQKNTEHTFKNTNQEQPAATLADVSWLVGSWKGTAFDSVFEENWNPPSANSMVGMFKLYDDEKGVNFYELLLIVEEQGSLIMKVKHFSADFTAWETKEEFIEFPLLKLEENAIHFAGLSFYRVGDNEITGYIALRHADGSMSEEELLYSRY